MSYLRSDLWCSAFLRRHNALGAMCVVRRRGDPIAGQIFIEIDHLDGTMTLYTPAPASLDEDSADRVFQRRFSREKPLIIEERIRREIDFDPDLWVIALETREDEPGLVVRGG
ncbi:hypothetical protein GCM10007989_26330 [Devosia pacifica]|uniref:DUF1491 domain-containing protein n=1 Tax=Devosia pacifica TaxID=1335967 RepID=A0A918S930_9HYPH|nr:DUF1491 family protein [Devosia pacifica]GHA29471.1 hypothetical protein GCM10007989_26330 [Devosia pacifica]